MSDFCSTSCNVACSDFGSLTSCPVPGEAPPSRPGCRSYRGVCVGRRHPDPLAPNVSVTGTLAGRVGSLFLGFGRVERESLGLLLEGVVPGVVFGPDLIEEVGVPLLDAVDRQSRTRVVPY